MDYLPDTSFEDEISGTIPQDTRSYVPGPDENSSSSGEAAREGYVSGLDAGLNITQDQVFQINVCRAYLQFDLPGVRTHVGERDIVRRGLDRYGASGGLSGAGLRNGGGAPLRS